VERRSLFVPLAVLAALMLGGCGGGSSNDGSALPKVASAKAVRDVKDGAAQLTTTIDVEMDRPFELAQDTVPLASEFELQVADPKRGASATARVLVTKVDHQAGTRGFSLSVAALVPDGATLKVERKTFKTGAVGQIEATISSDLSLAAVVFSTTALAPKDPAFLDDVPAAPVTAADSDPAVQRAALEAHLKLRGSNDSTVQAALKRFDTMPQDIIPSPKARAALAALTGTFAEPAIDSLLTNQNCTGKPAAQVVFQPPPGEPGLMARVTFTKERARIISLNPVLEGERIEHIMPFLAHESVHCDNNDTRVEEVVATGFDTFLYILLIAADPSVARPTTPVARELNVDAIALINSGARVPESVGLLPSAGIQRALPGTTATYGSFAELVGTAYPNVDAGTPVPEAVADAYVANLALAAALTPQPAFDLKFIDQLLGQAMDPRALAGAITALGLTPA
jgi:hypothetical protein